MGKKEKRSQPGRPPGTYQKRRFRDTNLGRLIYLAEPMLYRVICPEEKKGIAPDLYLITKVTGCSDNPTFQTERFKTYLAEYEAKGLHVPRVKPVTEDSWRYYRNLRLARALNYVRTHKREIKAREKLVRTIIQRAIDQVEGRP